MEYWCPLSVSVDSDPLVMGQFSIFPLVVGSYSSGMYDVGSSLYGIEPVLVWTGGGC